MEEGLLMQVKLVKPYAFAQRLPLMVVVREQQSASFFLGHTAALAAAKMT